MAGAVLSTAFHVNGPSRGLLFAAGGILIAVPAISGPPLGAWHALGHRAHRAVDWLVIAVLVASPAAPGRSAASIIVLEACAFLLWRLGVITRYEGRPVSPGRPDPGRRERLERSAPQPVDPAVDAAMRRHARAAGLTVGIIRRRRRAGR